MRFNQIHLANFRSHISTTLDLKRLTIIRGPNHAGKSSIEMAFETVLANHSEVTDAGGKGFAKLIRVGAKKANINLSVEDDGKERLIQCALSESGRNVIVTNPKNPQWAGGVEWADWLKLNRETFSCLCNNHFFVDQSEDKQKDILAAIVLPKTYDWPEWVKPAAANLALSIDWTKTPFEIIAAGYDLAFKARTNINRDVKNFKMPEGDITGAENLAEMEERIKTRRAELEGAVTALAHRKTTHASSGELREVAQKRLTESETRIAREEARVTALDALLLSPAKLKAAEKLAKDSGAAKKLDDEIVALDIRIGAAKGMATKLNALTPGESCPTCFTAITADMIANLAIPALQEADQLTARRSDVFDERKRIGDPVAAAASITAHKQALDDMERAKARVAEERVTARDAQDKLDELGAAGEVPDYSADEHAIEELRAKIQRGETAVAAARAAKNLLDRRETARGELATLTHKQKDVEKLVKYFDIEVKTELLAATIGPFAESMNAVLATWGYTCHLSIEPYVFAVTVHDSDQKPHAISLGQLSKSELHRFAVAFQVALALTTGFGFVIVDEADIYDQFSRGALFQALLNSELDQAIVIATDERDSVPDVEGAIFYRFDDIAGPGMVATTQVRKL